VVDIEISESTNGPKRLRSLRKLLRRKPTLFSLAVFTLLVSLSIFAPYVVPHDPIRMEVHDSFQAPNWEYFFGTDNFGRSLWSRTVYGIRSSLFVGATVVLLTTSIGTLMGLIAGYFRGLDMFLMRLSDVLMSFPSIILAMAIVAILGPSIYNAVIAITVAYIPRTARIAYSSTLKIKKQTFIEAARAMGAGGVRIMLKDVLPNCLAPLIIQATYVFALAILIEAALSFLGAGTPPPTPSLGGILSEAREYMRTAPWMIFLPGLVLMLLVLSINFLGDGLRDYLDPKMRGLR